MTMPSTIRVATWNLWWKHGPWEQRQAALAASLTSLGADVVGLQEVSFLDPDQPAWLLEHLGGHVVVAPRPDGQVDTPAPAPSLAAGSPPLSDSVVGDGDGEAGGGGGPGGADAGSVGGSAVPGVAAVTAGGGAASSGGAAAGGALEAVGADEGAVPGVARVMGNAIWSRWPIVESEWCWLDVGDAPRHRTVLWARLEAAFGPVDVFTTHLSHGFHQSGLRRRQIAEVVAFIAERRGPVDRFPPVLIGDLNAVPESDEIRSLVGLTAPPVEGLIFSDTWSQVGQGPGATWSSGNPYVVDSAWPERRLDYVMVGWPRARPAGNPVRARLFGVEPHDGVVPSDHYGVAVDLVEAPH
jgi:endonuclease/exonuclease/phosphatase family metal-dependent hydrolase